MINSYRNLFNLDFTQEKYQHFLSKLHSRVGTEIPFHISETPVFFPNNLQNLLIQSASEILHQALSNTIQQQTDRSIPKEFFVSGDESKPHFVQVDFALTQQNGQIVPQLIELQGFPTIYAFQYMLGKTYQEYYGFENFNYLPNQLSDLDFLNIMYRTLIGKHDPENVILLEIHPEQQKTYCDFLATKTLFNIEPVCVTKIKKQGSNYFYPKNGKWIPVYRIYNRVIFDEWQRKNIQSELDFNDVDSIEWITHPNWYYRISKFILPFLNHPSVPKSYFLSEKPNHIKLSEYVLKPLFSFAGLGVKVDVTEDDLHQIPIEEYPNFILQKKVEYAPLIRTLDEPAKIEVRVMLVRQESDYSCVNFLIRLSKGKMIGVDFNKNKTWVGSSAALFEK